MQINPQLECACATALLADVAAERSAAVTTWFLLYYRSQDDLLRAELSVPVQINDRGVIGGWRERILLPPRSFGAELKKPLDAGGDDGVEFDIAAR